MLISVLLYLIMLHTFVALLVHTADWIYFLFLTVYSIKPYPYAEEENTVDSERT